ncbi:hypothetical protein VCRA2119O430_20291 [Vibrio crassostreae]|nr:hypothetical protein VCRA2118O429_10294 [Vibrio crassostreae]CAK1861591.1 hypothetical protein VCRA2110O182_10485 [Vibrio crassostreae]CAK1877746.1 hypothetical protein VCRA2113O322_10492 [Vibrio crassostreae]CAK1975802.1 hypothetical protein VCRA2114O422_20136 [Vibrio crassostreae]CAK1977370.1 hypothetical protein VCRA2113O413_20096 [Vibrio crassostreae]
MRIHLHIGSLSGFATYQFEQRRSFEPLFLTKVFGLTFQVTLINNFMLKRSFLMFVYFRVRKYMHNTRAR